MGRTKVSNKVRWALQASAVIFGMSILFLTLSWMNKYNFSATDRTLAIIIGFSGLIMAFIDGWFLISSEV